MDDYWRCGKCGTSNPLTAPICENCGWDKAVWGGHRPAAPPRRIPGEWILVVGLVFASLIGLGGFAWYMSPDQACPRQFQAVEGAFVPVAGPTRPPDAEGLLAALKVEVERYDAMGCIQPHARQSFDELRAWIDE